MTLVSIVLMFWWGTLALSLLGCAGIVSRPGNFVDLLVSEIAGSAAVPVPDLHPSLVTDLRVEVLLGQAVVKRSMDSVRAEISRWPIPHGSEATFTTRMEDICKAASVEYQLFVLRLDVGSVASLGDLLGMDKKLNETHVQVGYAFAHAAGTLLQQRERVGYSCCKQHVLGICVDHTTCHKEVDRDETPEEMQEVTATLRGCLKHQVQHLRTWFPGYDDCNTQASCKAARPAVKGCSAATAVVAHAPASILASSRVAGEVPLPSDWFGTPRWNLTGGSDPWDSFQHAVKSVTSALQDIIDVFGSKTSTKLVKEETCLGFEHYRQNVSVLTLNCLEDAYMREALLKLLADDLLWFLKDKQQMQDTLFSFEHTSSESWTEFVFNLQSTSASTPRYLSVYKNKEKGATCSNWVIVRAEANIQLAPDLFIWDKSTSKFGGLFTDDEIIIQQVPHKISPSDVLLLNSFFKVLMYMELADTIGVSYAMPKLPHCTDAVVV